MTDKHFYIVGAVVLGVAYMLGHKAVAAIDEGVDAVGDAINPTSTDNLIYKGINAVGDIIDDGEDDDSFSLGSWIWEKTHPELVAKGY